MIVASMITALVLGAQIAIVIPVTVVALTLLALRAFRPGLLGSGFLVSRRQFLAQMNTVAEPQPPQLTPLMLEIPRDKLEVAAFASGDGWRFGDFRHTVEYDTSNLEIRGEYRYFSVIELEMGRELPAIVFVSKKLKSHAFGWILDDSQKASLEGDFDNYFDTYFPIHYHIDARSVISPEVMVALLELKDCDIEFYGTRIFVYCVTPDHTMVAPMINKSLEVKRRLSDHIVYYRDELLGNAQDRYNVSPVGSSLRRSGLGQLLVFVFLVLVVGSSLWAFITLTLIPGARTRMPTGDIIEFLFYTPIAAFLAYGAFWSYRDTKRKNRQKDEEYQKRMRGK